MLDPQLRQRILRSLRWLVRDTQYRFDDCKQQIAPEEQGGYSPELKEAIQLLQDLEQGTMFIGAPESRPIHSEQECIDEGNLIGMTTRESIEFFLQYHPQWERGPCKKLMVDLHSEMRRWRLRNQEDVPEPVRVQGKTPRQLDKERQKS